MSALYIETQLPAIAGQYLQIVGCAVVIGVGVGVLGWLGVKAISILISIQARQAEREREVNQ